MPKRNPPQPRNNLGTYGEQAAATFLIRHGYRIVERNFRARYGEIDIIAETTDTLVFVEVKTRMSAAYGTPQEAVTSQKLRDVAKTARYYVQLHPTRKSLRIDVVAVRVDPETRKVRSLEHIPNVTADRRV